MYDRIYRNINIKLSREHPSSDALFHIDMWGNDVKDVTEVASQIKEWVLKYA